MKLYITPRSVGGAVTDWGNFEDTKVKLHKLPFEDGMHLLDVCEYHRVRTNDKSLLAILDFAGSVAYALGDESVTITKEHPGDE